MYGSKNADQYDGDCIVEVGDMTYVGRLMPGYQRSSNDLPVEQQPVWQIERIDTIATPVVSANPETEETYTYKTRRMYPNGRTGYEFCINDAQEYTYDYRH